jgi:hypothetical protein
VIEGALTIPADVKSIGAYAFYGCTGITELNVPTSVTAVGADAFGGVAPVKAIIPMVALAKVGKTALQELELLDGTSLAASALKNCTALQSVTLPATLSSMGKSAFEGCTALSRVNYAGTFSDWFKITFANATANPLHAEAVLYIDGVNVFAGDVEIPADVTELKAYVFVSLKPKKPGRTITILM